MGMKLHAALLVSAALLATTVSADGVLPASVASPDGRLTFTVDLRDGAPVYTLTRLGRPVVLESRLGLELRDGPGLAGGFVLDGLETRAADETWTPVWGEVKQIRNHHRELAVTLRQKAVGDRRMVVRVRVFDDGVGFRYEMPEHKDLTHFVVTDERTEFRLPADPTAFWIPGDYDTNEYRYTTSKLRGIDAIAKSAEHPSIAVRTPFARTAVQTPLMLKTPDGLYLNVHEAALVHYPAMNLVVDTARTSLVAHLVPDAIGNKAYLQAPAHTPWRTIVVSDKATDILASKLILNLNEPSRIADTGWIKPQKFVGVWWEMHVGTATWSYAADGNVSLLGTDWAGRPPSGKHGATTANVKRYVDFAARHGIDGVLVEGWNVGWEDWFGKWKEEVFDFLTPYPDFDLPELKQYAATKGVKLIMHHETSGSVTNYERRLDEAFRFMKTHGYDAVKTGYVGRIIPRGEFHDGQWMVDHYLRVAEKAARERIMIDSHEPVRPTGLHRTWPNWLAAEAARGNEFNAWSEGNPPEHETILPFTRLMGGPMDYTPGIFQIRLDHWTAGKKERVHTTLAKQLALYVTLYSPLQMAADLPEAYEKRLDAFQFIKDVAVDWDDTRVLLAEPGDHVTIARLAKGRDAWFVGSITDENARTTPVSLSFLPRGRKYAATIYADAPDAHWDTNPMAYRIERRTVDADTTLELKLAPGGGAAVSLVAVP
jgi:hypothetical protein